tara:strand:+ start:1629 stop:1739 length:111 start_codon:yes stop_codon:yes gene_type:complete
MAVPALGFGEFGTALNRMFGGGDTKIDAEAAVESHC